MTKPARCHRAFTLVEILIVVVILAVLAMIVIPQFASATDSARYRAFITDLDTYTEAMIHYAALHGYPPDGSSGVLPAALEPFINKGKFESGTPLGGVWDTELNDSGVVSAVGVHFNGAHNPGDDVMAEIDSLIDDGDLGTGGFRKLADGRYYAVIHP